MAVAVRTGNRVAQNVAVEITDNGAALRILGWGEHVTRLPELWPLLTTSFVERERLWFERVGEGSWPPLSAPYAQWKAAHFPGRPMLVRSGDLKASLTDPARAVLAETDHMLVLGSDTSYGAFHQTGTKKMPARRPLAPVQRILAGVAAQLEQWISYPHDRFGGRR